MKTTNAIVKKLYPLVEKSLSSGGVTKYKKAVSNYVTRHNAELYDIAPFSRIFYSLEDREEIIKAIGISEDTVTSILKETYYWQIANFNPKSAKDPLTMLLLTVVRYFYMKNMTKELELSSIYLAFSPKVYASIHSGSCPKFAPDESPKNKAVMEYVVNNELSNKFDIKREGSVFGAIRSICLTWLDTYEKRFKTADDEDMVYIFQQLHNRIKSMMHNIMEIYYDALEKGDAYLVYNSDSNDEDNYRVADSNILIIERITEKAMIELSTGTVNYAICKMVSDSNVKTDELKNIIESILSNHDNIPAVKEIVRLLITTYFNEPGSSNDVRDISFITFSMKPKPNTKDPYMLKMKDICEDLLLNNAPAYKRRRNRAATKSSYEKAILGYFALVIHNSYK